MTKEEELIEKLVKLSGKSREEIEQMVEKKINEFNGLISRSGAILLVARELGVDLKEKKVETKKIIDLEQWSKARVIAKVKKVFGKYKYSKGEFVVALLEDETGSIKAVIWNPKSELKEGETIEAVGRVKVNPKTGKVEFHIDGNFKKAEAVQVERKKEKEEKRMFVGICIVNYGKKQTSTGRIVSKARLTNLKKELYVITFQDFDWEVGKIYKVIGRYARDKKGYIYFIADRIEEASVKELESDADVVITSQERNPSSSTQL